MSSNDVNSQNVTAAGEMLSSNEPLAVGDLPRLDATDFVTLDPAYRRVRTTLAIAWGIIVAVATVVAWAATSSAIALIVGAVLLVLIGSIGAAQRVEFRYMGYLTRERDVSFRRGVVSRSVATVPFARVQHVSIERGPIDRRIGLAALQLRTAGGHLAIPGLADDTAERLKSFVGERATALADAEIDGDVATASPPTPSLDDR